MIDYLLNGTLPRFFVEQQITPSSCGMPIVQRIRIPREIMIAHWSTCCYILETTYEVSRLLTWYCYSQLFSLTFYHPPQI